MTSIVLSMISYSNLAGGMESDQETSYIRPADPPGKEVREEMVRWKRVYREEMTPVREQWSRVVKTMYEGRISELAPVCSDFKDRVEKLDREKLYAVADPVVRTWLGRGLVLLEGAARQCRRDRFFDLGFRLHKARQVIQSIDRRLEKYQ